ncbi:hypothetical protein ACEWY4_025350 [Coilia grayii]|uniref:Fibronectin type-III domain-containing protein n=1 Tax=Coilia grayii TaxID=363190 RepID=A0ABD1IZ29_9TELE
MSSVSSHTPHNVSTNTTSANTISISTTASTVIPADTTSTSEVSTTTISLATSIPTSDAPSTTTSPSTSSPCFDDDSDIDDFEEFIEDACLALLSIGMWWERACSEELPYICYDDRFHGVVNVSNITYTSASLSWLEAPGAISGYRVEVKSDLNNWTEALTSNLSSELKNLTAGTKYTVYVFPIKCERDLNPQTTYFYSQPDFIQNLTVPTNEIQETSVTLYWLPPAQGGVDFYHVCLKNTSSDVTCHRVNITKHTFSDLEPGGNYTVEVSAEVADMSIPGRRFNQTFYTKPSIVTDLEVTEITTSTLQIAWHKPNGYSSSYHVTVRNTSTSVNKTTSSTTESFSDLEPGSKFDIRVVAQLQTPNGILDGRPVQIEGFTNPNPVNDLSLTVEAHSLTATWGAPGSYENFSVTLQALGADTTAKTITNKTEHKFTDLKAGANYTVTVFVYGIKGRTSAPKSKSMFTLPNKPRNPSIASENKTCISLKWDVPENSEQVTIQYDVKFKANFWNETNKTRTDTTNYTWCNLRSGTTYHFNVSVFAGNQNSEDVTVKGQTDPILRNITLNMLCASNYLRGCRSTQSKIKLAVKDNFSGFLDGIFFNLTIA